MEHLVQEFKGLLERIDANLQPFPPTAQVAAQQGWVNCKPPSRFWSRVVPVGFAPVKSWDLHHVWSLQANTSPRSSTRPFWMVKSIVLPKWLAPMDLSPISTRAPWPTLEASPRKTLRKLLR